MISIPYSTKILYISVPAATVNPAVKGPFGNTVTIPYFYKTERSLLLVRLADKFIGRISPDSQQILNILHFMHYFFVGYILKNFLKIILIGVTICLDIDVLYRLEK